MDRLPNPFRVRHFSPWLATCSGFFILTFWLLYTSRHVIEPEQSASNLEDSSAIRCIAQKPAKRVAIVGQSVALKLQSRLLINEKGLALEGPRQLIISTNSGTHVVR